MCFRLRNPPDIEHVILCCNVFKDKSHFRQVSCFHLAAPNTLLSLWLLKYVNNYYLLAS